MTLFSRPDHESQASVNANADRSWGQGDRPSEQSHASRIVHRLSRIKTLAVWCRRSLAPALLAASLITGMLAVQTPLSVSYAALTTIIIDGNGSDWTGTPAFTESGTDAGGGSGDITALRITNDATNIYVRWDEILTANKSKIASDGFSILVNTSGGGGTDAIGWVMVDAQGAATVTVEQPIGTRTVTGSAQQSCNVQVCANGAAVFLEAAFPRSALGATGDRIVGIAGQTLASASFSSNVKDCIPGAATCSGFFSLDTSDGNVTVNAGDTTVTTVVCTSNPDVVNVVAACTATVTDSTTPSNVPTGAVTWTTTGSGSFGSTSCTLSGGACQVAYTPSVTGTATITASYSGDTTSVVYMGSSGTTSLVVNSSQTITPTAVSTDTPTPTSTATPTAVGTDTPTPTSTATPTAAVGTDTPTPTSTATPTGTVMGTASLTPTPRSTSTPTPPDATPTVVSTAMATAASPTTTPTAVQGTATPPSLPPPPPPASASAPSNAPPFHPAPPQALSSSSGGGGAQQQSVPAGELAAIDLGSFAAHPSQGPWTVVVDWGDGTSQTLTVGQPGGIGGVPHTYIASGTYSVVTTLTDRLGLSAGGSLTVLVTSRMPTSTRRVVPTPTPAVTPTLTATATAAPTSDTIASVTSPATALVGEAIDVSWTEQPPSGGTLAMYPAGQAGAAPQMRHSLGSSTDGTVIFTAPSGVPAVEFRLYADTGALRATSGVTTIGAPPPACAAAEQPRQVLPEQEQVVTTVGEQYYTTTFPCFWVSGPVILSADEAGLVPFATDDAMSIDVVRPDGTHASWSFDFSAQCTIITDSDPVDVSAYFQPGVNRVTLWMNDSCGTVEGSAALFFSVPRAPVDDGRAPPPTPSDPGAQPVGTLDGVPIDIPQR